MAASVNTILVPRFRDDCLVSKGIEVTDLLRLRKDSVLFVHPCSSEVGKLMADVELTKNPDTRFVDPETLCSLLEIHRRRFAELKCSSKLGVARLKWGGREISIFKNGKIKIQLARDREEVMRVASSTSRLLWGAAICEVCGRPALSCASEECGKCASEDRVHVDITQMPNSELLEHGYANLRTAHEAPAEDLEGLLRRAQYLALLFTIEAPRKTDASIGLVLMGETERLSRELGLP